MRAVRDELLVAALLVSLLLVGSEAFAQAHAGAAIVVSRLPGLDYTPGTIDRPPSGLVVGGVFSGGATLTPWIVLQGELSIPTQLTNESVSSHPGATIEGSTRHRDTIVSALLRVVAAPWCEVLVGGGVTFDRTEVQMTIRDHLTGLTTPYLSASSSATRATFTTGVDLPIRLPRGVALVPTGRMHVVARPELPSTFDDRPMATPSKYVFRFGIGGRVEF